MDCTRVDPMAESADSDLSDLYKEFGSENQKWHCHRSLGRSGVKSSYNKALKKVPSAQDAAKLRLLI